MLLRGIVRQGNRQPGAIRMRCPGCLDRVTLEGANEPDWQFVSESNQQSFAAGQRWCPNPTCRTHIFVVYNEVQGRLEVLAAYPAERIDFDATNLPAPVLSAIEEAIICHAHECYVASAIMVRKTLEEVCRDRGAEGGTLKERIAALGGKVVLPQALLDGLDDLRLLGNDAAHVESREYEQIGKEEVEVALDVAKEILKATYQLESIVGRLKTLRREH
jgi:hypothetical protein